MVLMLKGAAQRSSATGQSKWMNHTPRLLEIKERVGKRKVQSKCIQSHAEPRGPETRLTVLVQEHAEKGRQIV